MSSPIKFLDLSLSSARKCPVCGWTGREFKKVEFPYKPAISLVCPSCRSYERHRFAYLVLKKKIADLEKDNDETETRLRRLVPNTLVSYSIPFRVDEYDPDIDYSFYEHIGKFRGKNSDSQVRVLIER